MNKHLHHTAHAPSSRSLRRRVFACALLAACAGLSACSSDEARKAGQALVSVNGEEITAMQLNEELQRANIQQAQQDVASKRLLEGLIDRQLLQNEAVKEELDRDPKVVQAIERAKALIVAQAYMQKKIGAIDKPSPAEVSGYYEQHPEFFANRKQFDMKQLVIDTRDLTAEAQQAADKADTLDDMAAWFDANKVKYVRTQASRTTSDLAPDISARLKGMTPGELFVVKEGPRSMLITITDIKDNPASLALAGPQIERYLMTKRGKERAEAELKRLRTAAQIEYLNKEAALAAAPAAAAAPAGAAQPAAAPSDDATARGVAGLK